MAGAEGEMKDIICPCVFPSHSCNKEPLVCFLYRSESPEDAGTSQSPNTLTHEDLLKVICRCSRPPLGYTDIKDPHTVDAWVSL